MVVDSLYCISACLRQLGSRHRHCRHDSGREIGDPVQFDDGQPVRAAPPADGAFFVEKYNAFIMVMKALCVKCREVSAAKNLLPVVLYNIVFYNI